MTLLQRVKRLEQAQAPGGVWWNLETWQAETAAGVSYDEQETRRLAEHPQHTEEICQLFERVRQRVEAALCCDLS